MLFARRSSHLTSTLVAQVNTPLVQVFVYFLCGGRVCLADHSSGDYSGSGRCVASVAVNL